MGAVGKKYLPLFSFRNMSNLLKHVLFLALEILKINAFFRLLNRGKVKVLMYHSISIPGQYFTNAVSPESFSRQISYLRRNFAMLRITQNGDFIGYDRNRVNILLTFDDGFIDNYNIAAKVLVKNDVYGIFFLIADCLSNGSPPWFINTSSNYKLCESHNTLNAQQAKELILMGHAVGSHSLSHLNFADLTLESGIHDALASKKQIESLLGFEITSFSFPWGKFIDGQPVILSRYFRRVFTTKHGFNSIGDNVFYRNEVAGFFHMCATASGALDFISFWKARK